MTAHKVGEHVEIEEEDARAGQTGTHLRYILAFGVALVILGFAFAAVSLLS
jgi:hypothetical protein